MSETSGRLTVPGLLKAASARANLTDFGDDFFREGLGVFVEALNEEAKLSTNGYRIAEGRIVEFLVNRLEMRDWHKRYPEIAREKIERPIFIIGMARSGTTILHDLMAQDPANRVPQTWEVNRPCPPPKKDTYDTDPRIAEEQARIDMSDRYFPALRTMHPMGARLPQECGIMRCNEFASASLRNMFRVPSYAKWFEDSLDFGPVYAAQRRQLQLMQWRCHGERWVLKSPQHLYSLPELVKEFPDARLIQTHRDPVPALASLTSLSVALRRMASDSVDAHAAAREWLDHVPASLDRAVAFRETSGFDKSCIVDLQFSDFMQNPVGTVAGIYEQFGLTFTSEVRTRMQKFIDDNPADKHGKHKYSFADTGLDLEVVRTKMRRYQDYFGVRQEVIR